MTVKLYAFTCGTLTCALGNLMAGGTGEITVPVPAYLIEHDKGCLLFDTGLHPDLRRDPAARLGERLASMFRVAFGRDEDVAARLEAIDRDPAGIDLIIASHLHFDHVGGNALIPNATLLVQRREWCAGMNPDTARLVGFDSRDFDLGHSTRIIEGEHDVFGDGSVICLPTHGHTPGHQSLRVRLASGEVVLAADACYFCATLRQRKLPPRMFDREEMLASIDRLEALERGGARIFFGHDPEFWRDVPQAPALVV
jgi:N-acyl homoserine lactone hydrolase